MVTLVALDVGAGEGPSLALTLLVAICGSERGALRVAAPIRTLTDFGALASTSLSTHHALACGASSASCCSEELGFPLVSFL